MGMIRIVRCLDAERIAYGGIEVGRMFYTTDTNKVWIGTAGGDLDVTTDTNTTTLLGLTDTPATFVGQSLKHARVNVGETALEFADPYTTANWTPAIVFGGAAVGVTYNAATTLGRYMRIGNWVMVSGRMQLTSKGTSVGNAQITPMPFTCKNYDGSYAILNLYLNYVTFANQWFGFMSPNTDDLNLYEQTEGGTQTNLTNTDFANNSVVMFGGVYEVEP